RIARNLPATPGAFLRAVAPFRDGLIVARECMHCWYWLADSCRDENIAFVLGHAWAMKAVHGCKTKCDRKDAEAIAPLLKRGHFPPAYAYPRERSDCLPGQGQKSEIVYPLNGRRPTGGPRAGRCGPRH